MSEQTKLPNGDTISNVPIENVLAGKNYDGSTGDLPVGPNEIVRAEADAGGDYLANPDGLFAIRVFCDDLRLKLHIQNQLRYFLNDPERSVEFLPKIKSAIEREELTNTTIGK